MLYDENNKTRKQPGVYAIKSKATGKMYIGSTVNLIKRYREHKSLLKNNKHFNNHLQNHCNKYGINDLVFLVLNVYKKETVHIYEQVFYDIHKPDFNIGEITKHPMLGKKHKESSKLKMSLRSSIFQNSEKGKEFKKRLSKIHKGNKYNLGNKHSEETKKKISETSKGRKHSKETRKKISLKLKDNPKSTSHKKSLSKALMGNKNNLGNKLSDDTKDKIRRKHCNIIIQRDLEGNFVKEHFGSNEAAKSIGYKSQSNIIQCCIGKRLTAGGYKWEYKEKQN